MLGLTVASWLYEQWTDADEGSLSRARAALVNRRALADGRYVRLDRFCFLAAAFVVWSCRR